MESVVPNEITKYTRGKHHIQSQKILKTLIQLPQLYRNNYLMYIEIAPYDTKESYSLQAMPISN